MNILIKDRVLLTCKPGILVVITSSYPKSKCCENGLLNSLNKIVTLLVVFLTRPGNVKSPLPPCKGLICMADIFS